LAFKTCRVGQLSVMCSKRQRLDDVALWHGIVFGVVCLCSLAVSHRRATVQWKRRPAGCMHALMSQTFTRITLISDW